MKSAFSNSKILYIFLLTSMTGFLASCGNDQAPSKKNVEKIQIAAQQESESQLFLTYLDSVARLPLAGFDEASVQALNQKFSKRLPLIMYDEFKKNKAEKITIQVYKNEAVADPVKSGAIFLVPNRISKSLHISDFTRYFGSIKKEKPLMGVTAQPLPVQIAVSSGTGIKLTFNDHEEPEQAEVISVEILKYK